MRVMIIRKADSETEAGALPSEQLIGDMAAYNEALVDAGVMKAGEGLKPSARGARVKFTNGRPTVVDGPFSETKELIAGFTLLEVQSMAEAIEWVKRWPVSDGHGAVELEVRPLYEMSDLGSSEAMEPHVRLRERLGGR
jgi:hypothetical protein